MKQKYLKHLFTALLLLCATVASAHDFYVNRIYYRVVSWDEKTVHVSYGGTYHSDYIGEYRDNIAIPENVLYLGKEYKVIGIDSYAFYDCSQLLDVSIPNSIIRIGESAFAGCSDLTSIEIPNSVANIGKSAFSGCSGLTNVTISSSATSIGDYTFEDCKSLLSIVIPDCITKIGNSVFKGCTSLVSIVIPENVTSIGNQIFNECSNLTSVAVADENVIYDSRENCNAIIEAETNTLIAACKNTVIPNTVTNIGDNAFYGCLGLTNVQIPNSVTNIGSYAFYKCSSLIDITIPNSVTNIEKFAFYGCSGLTSVVIPNSVTSIGSSAFMNCDGLTSVVIPNSVTSIGDYAFYNCSALVSITSQIAGEDLFVPGIEAFTGIDKTKCTLYVPRHTRVAYLSTNAWNLFSEIVELPGEFELLVSAACYATLYLNYTVEIPEGVEVYIAKEVKGEKLKMEQVADILPANTAVIVRAKPGTYTFSETDDVLQNITENLLEGTVKNTFITAEDGIEYYVLSIVDGEVGMYRALLSNNGFINNAYKAYLPLRKNGLGIYDDKEVDTSSGGQLGNGFRFDFGGTTAIEDVEVEAVASGVYNLQGRIIKNPRNGIYIIDGKKVYIK